LRAEELDEQPSLPPISYEVRSLSSGLAIAGTFVNANARIEPLFRRAFAEVEQLSTEPGADGTQRDLHLDLLVSQESRHSSATFTLGLICVATIGLIPAYGQEELTLDARLQRGGQTIATYVYTDRVETWIQLFLLPWAFRNDPQDVAYETFDNLVLHLLADLRRELPALTSDG
jgi:hypothetical protein